MQKTLAYERELSKGERLAQSLPPLIGDTLIIYAVVIGVMGSLITLFSLAVSMSNLAIIWFVGAVALSVSAARLSWKYLLIVIPIGMLALWFFREEVIIGAQSVLRIVTTEHSRYLYLPVLFPYAEALYNEKLIFIGAVGFCLAILLSITIVMLRSVTLMFLTSIAFAFPIFVVAFEPPNIIFLILILGAHLALLIYNALNECKWEHKWGAVIPALALSFVLLAAASAISPPGTWSPNDRVREFGRTIRVTLANLGMPAERHGIGWPHITDGQWRFDTEISRVADAGRRVFADIGLLEVTATHPGIFYLRGFSQEYFDGRSWQSRPMLQEDEEHLRYIEQMSLTMPALIVEYINWNHFSEQMYLQGEMAEYLEIADIEVYRYFPLAEMFVRQTGDTTVLGYYRPNFMLYRAGYYPYGLDFFLVHQDITDLRGRSAHLPIAELFYQYSVAISQRGTYTQIAPETAEALRSLAMSAGINPYDDRETIARQVAGLVIAAAHYSSTPAVTPEGEDFALFFLTHTRRGYCIHFATAATLMLRALDVPARFTSGFLVAIMPDDVNRPVEVTDRFAHAWVEVFLEDFGWASIEVTPASEDSPVPAGLRTDADFFRHAGMYIDFDMFLYEYLMDEGFFVPGDGILRPGVEETADPIEINPLIPIALVLLTLLILRKNAQSTRERNFLQADTNAAAISIWRSIIRLCPPDEVPEEIEDIALKARFSQHTLSEEERRQMFYYFAELRSKIYSESGTLGRAWMKIINKA